MTAYLDNAATTLQKPPSVARAMAAAVGSLAGPGRGGHSPAMRAGQVAFDCRQAVAELFHVDGPENVIFTFNATHGLNIAVKSLVKPGDTVVASGYEHNAVTRPFYALGCEVKVAAGPLFDPGATLEAFERLVTPEVACVACTHVSNAFGFVLPVKEIADLCRRRGVPMILDASQSAGVLPVHMEELGCAYIAMPGHKGLYGPQGTGLLLCREGETPATLLEGGTGSLSAQKEMPDFLPDRLEAGTHNMPGIAGLLEGIRYVTGRGEGTILRHEQALTTRAVSALEKIPGVTVYAGAAGTQTGVVSFTVDGLDCEDVGERLARQGIAVRTGLHCAPLAHRTAGTLETGTVRASFSVFNTARDVERLTHAVGQMTR